MQPGLRAQLGSAIRDGRHARRWTQEALGHRARVSRSMIGAVEGGWANPSLGVLERIAGALGAELVLDLRLATVIGRADRADAAHARCVAAARRALERHGFICAVECEIVDGRLRGWIDLLAFDPVSSLLLVVEVKTELRDLGGLLRQVGWYQRTAGAIAQRRGWHVRRTVAVVVFLATDANDASLVANREAITASFPIRGRAARDLLTGSAVTPGSGWALSMIDPRRRRDSVWAASRLDGRRTPAPYRSYADFMTAVARR
jgi:transcriptional regulator with XRE-family HTH domain